MVVAVGVVTAECANTQIVRLLPPPFTLVPHFLSFSFRLSPMITPFYDGDKKINNYNLGSNFVLNNDTNDTVHI